VIPRREFYWGGGYLHLFSGHFHGIGNISPESLAQAQSIVALLSKLGERGVCGHVQKSKAHALGCRPRGESSHWGSNSLQTSRDVPA
jgi:hypothetical protein